MAHSPDVGQDVGPDVERDDGAAGRSAGFAATGALLLGGGLVGGTALVRASVDGAVGDLEQIGDPATYRLAAVATVAAAVGALLLLGVSAGSARGLARAVATAAAGSAATALLLLAGVRYAAPDLAVDLPDVAPALTTGATSACAFAAFVALGLGVVAAPGPTGSVRVLGRAAGGCCVLGPTAAALVGARDAGAGYGLALASTAIGVLLVTAWGLTLAVSLRRG